MTWGGKAMVMIHPYIQTQHGVLFSGDCLDIMREIKPEIVECVFADPPFNLDKDYKNGSFDKVEADKYFEWSRRWINECVRIIKPGGAFFLYAMPELNVRFANYLSDRINFRHWTPFR